MLVGRLTHLLTLCLLRVNRVVVDDHMGMEAGDGRSRGGGITVTRLSVLVVLLAALVTTYFYFGKQLAELVALNDVLRLRGVVYRERRGIGVCDNPYGRVLRPQPYRPHHGGNGTLRGARRNVDNQVVGLWLSLDDRHGEFLQLITKERDVPVVYRLFLDDDVPERLDEKEETPSDGQTIYEERSGVREGLSIPTTVNAALSMRKASAFSDELIDLVADRIFDLSGDYVDVSKYGLNADQATIKEYLSRERMTTSYYHKLVLRIADELDLSTREVQHCLTYALLQKYGKESLEELMEWGTEEESFPTIDDHVDTYFDFEISDRTQSIGNALSIDDNTYEWMIGQETKAMVERFLSILTPKEAEVIRMRYGIGYDEPMTLEAIGSILNVTRERVRQIETKAMRRLVKRKEYLFEGKFFTDD